MGFWSTLGSIISEGISAVGQALGKVGMLIGTLASALAPHIALICSVVSAICSVIGLFKDKHEAEDYGAAMRQAEKKPEDFDSTNDYIDYLSEEIREGRIDLDKEKSEAEKWIDRSMGSALGIMAINEKFGLESGVAFWKGIGQKFEEGKLDGKDIESILKNASQKGIDIEDIGFYVQNEEPKNGSKKSDISQSLKDSLKESKPELSEQELTQKYNELVKERD